MDTTRLLTLFTLTLALCVSKVDAQTTYIFPFVTINPSAASSGMGECGIATLPQDATSTFFNSAKLQFMDDKAGGSLSYVPYLNLVDFFLIYLAGYHKIGKNQTISASFRYSNFGTLNLANTLGQSLGSATPQQFSVNVNYAVRLGKRTSLSGNFGAIHSNIFDFSSGASQAVNNKINAIILGLNFFWINKEIELADWKVIPSFGISINNIGISNPEQGYLPSGLKLGYAFQGIKDGVHELNFAVDLSKFLVPSVDPKVNSDAFKVLYQSFSDAPGGFKEELDEIFMNLGLSYTYSNFFTLRGGYVLQNPTKSTGSYATLGIGLVLQVLSLDLSYLISDTMHLNGIFKLSIGVNINDKAKKSRRRR